MKIPEQRFKIVVIGGSAGSFSVVSRILSQLDPAFPLPVVLCLHRLKHVRSGLVEGLNMKSNIPVVEPYDKDKLKPGVAMLAPSNYHLFVEFDSTISLSTEEVNNHSRPSIDYAFSSAAYSFREKAMGIILTGANKDGAMGIKNIHEKKGYTIVQDPSTCDVDAMPQAALKLFTPDQILKPDDIVKILNGLKA
ncbi:chemotaxis protein CheB [Anaerophaga thermohalophila]|jgi:two-component system chemotaxis response regulator CheB|uniref:chemotaxis protein CheB n=1 Tax=Anaerophaga thermohalophila TaxID=177400 RepID=UPI0002F0F99C|nr:chemotaxis protein CheB [Anaerophaga thermohalophila]